MSKTTCYNQRKYNRAYILGSGTRIKQNHFCDQILIQIRIRKYIDAMSISWYETQYRLRFEIFGYRNMALMLP